MHAALATQTVSEIIDQRLFGVEYQPLVDCAGQHTVAYEALARFYDPAGRAVSPLEVFRRLHDSPMLLARVEYQLKQVQLEYRPGGTPLFINLDPDAYHGFGYDGADNPLLQLLADEPALVVELIENTSITDAEASESLSDALRGIGKQLALDDVGAPDSVVSLPILSIVDYIKFDRSWLQRWQDPTSLVLLDSLVSYARRTGKQTVLEGVESEQHLQQARQLGFDLVQGYLYRDRFINARLDGYSQVPRSETQEVADACAD